MILYQLAKWMEERSLLLLIMQENGKDLKTVAEKKAAVERKLLRQAELWRQGRFCLAELWQEPLEAVRGSHSSDPLSIRNRLDLQHLPQLLPQDAQLAESETYM